MPVTADGPLSEPVESLAELISNSTTFQTWTGSADATEADSRIYRFAVTVDDEGKPLRPFVLISLPTGEYRVSRGGYGKGSLTMLFEDNVPEAYKYSHKDASLYFANNLGNVLKEIMENSESLDGALFIPDHGIKVVQAPARSSPMEGEDENDFRGDYFQAIFNIPFGLESNP